MKRTDRFRSANKEDMINVVSWIPYGKVRAILQISHGMVEYIDRYDDFAEYLNRYGILVVGNDHLGHGGSVKDDEGLGYFAKKNASKILVKDLHCVTVNMKKRYPGVPYFLLGHSMGSFLARRYIMTYGEELTGAIIMGTGSQSSAALTFAKTFLEAENLLFGERYRSKFCDWLMFGRYNKRIENKRTEKDWLTNDKEMVDKYLNDKLCTFLFTNNGLRTIMDTISFIQKPENIDKIPENLPIYLVAGKEDPVGNYGKAVLEVYETYKLSGVEDISVKLYENYRHELINEVNNQEVYDDIRTWIEDRI